ncbi:MAG: NAD-dependent deacylase [Bacteroidales bacterium]|nr:NAD-dependent deacylase [Bacteroidales bacterium]
MIEKINQAAKSIKNAKKVSVFTGAGISVESGIPPFRGPDGLWSRYDPKSLDLNFYLSNPKQSWKVIKEIFYDFFGQAKPNKAHTILAEMEAQGYISAIITQNIDNLHQKAGSKNIIEFHGNSQRFVCPTCSTQFGVHQIQINDSPPICFECKNILKPDFIFFGEDIPVAAFDKSIEIANTTDLMIIIGSTGEVIPACNIPFLAKQNGALIIEINPSSSNFTNAITDSFLQGKATEIMENLSKQISKNT